MDLNDIKKELEEYLGYPVSQSIFKKCLDAFTKGRHGPAALGGYAFMGYFRPFQDALGESFDQKIVCFFCGSSDKSELIRKELFPHYYNPELLPRKIRNAYWETYKDEPYYNFCEWWYERFIWSFLKAGIPEDGVAGIIRKHKIPIQLVKKSGASSGLRPETVAQNVLNHRHDSVEYDSLATHKIRVTKKKIADFRRRLEEELRHIWSNPKSLEETIQEECYDASDEDISRMIQHGTKPEVWARNLNEI